MSISRFESDVKACPNCGLVVWPGEEKIFTERHGFSEGPFETFAVCPRCNEVLSFAVQCEKCGEYFAPTSVFISETICEECLKNG